MEESHGVSSVKSKRSTASTGIQRKAPYRIGKLELQLLFVPKPKGAKDEDMPKSMNACIRELKEAEANSIKSHEGHLSQQGGDCPVSGIIFPVIKLLIPLVVLASSIFHPERLKIHCLP